MVSFLGIFAAVVIIANQQHCVDAGDLCPSGWFSYRHYCYTNGIGKGYWDARKACQDLGADLTTMVDTNETKALADWLQEKSGLIDIWIGLHNAEATTYPVSAGGFKWTDGTDVDPAYDNWFVNNENKKEPTSGDRYVRFYRFNGTAPVKWAAAGNGQTIKGYICKKVTWNTTAKHCFDGNCYRISAEEFSNATTAENECKKHSMNVLQNGKFPVALYRTFSLDNITTDQFWMEYDGLTKCRSLYSNTTCPAANKSARVICIGPSDLKCPCDWHDLDDNCYYIGNTETNHTGAANQCKRFNAAFLEITSHIENRFIKNVINKSHTYWIANNSTSPYCQLNQDKCPNFQSINATGNWTDAKNSASHHIVCKKKKSDLGSEICIDNHPGECYKFSRQAVTSLVNATCDPDMKILNETVLEERYSDLAALVNSSNVMCASYWIQSNVSKFFPVKNDSETNTTKAHYICFKDHNECNSSSCNNGTCIDGFRNYTCKCEAGFTGSNCETNINDCKSNPCLHNSTCTDEVNGYKCSCSQGYQGTNCELGPLCPSGWVSHKNACYRIFLKSPKGYWEARKECQNSGADLATMNDKNETKVLSDTMKPENGQVDLWIGLHNSNTTANKGNSTGYNWTDGTPLDETYDNWYVAGGNKEPTRGDQYMRFFRKDTNASVKWAAAGNATDKKGYICKKETWDTSSQHCFDDFCYKISATPFYNATDAEAECTKNNMTVVEHGKFPDPLNKTFGLDEIISKAFWLEHKTSTQFSTGTAARVICKGPVDMRCPCGWSGIEKYCYYLGKESQDKKESHKKCKDLGANLTGIRSHTENKFIKSILDQAHTYWIRNQKKAPYCGLNEDYCGEYNTIIGNGTWKNSSSSERHHYICKRKRRDLQEPSDFCIDSFPGECYNFSKVALNHSHLPKATCGQGMTILDEEILHQSNVSRELAKAIHSIKVSCNSYWIFSTDPKVISAVNDTVIVEKADQSTLAPYICVQENDECASSPCNNNGTCVDEFRNFSCKCLPGFSGTVCEQEIPSYTLPAAIGSVLAVAAICIIVFFIFYYYRKGSLKGLLVIGIPMVETGRGDKMRNQANQHCPGADQNAPPPFKANAAGCVLTVKKLKESGQRIIADSNRPTLVAEFKSIPMEENYDMDIGMDPANKIRNRFRNIIPYNHNRVILSGTNLDYINASYINTSRRDKEFLASQGPKPETLADFWQMIWDEDVTVIIMLTNLVEGGKRKCEQYWPDVRNQQTYGDVVTKTTKEQILPSYTLRKIKAFKNEETHTISHYHFRVWPDHGVPHTAMALLNFRNKTKSDMLSSKTPVLVHCSAGVGRTGTFIGLDLLIDEAEGRKKVNIYSCVAELRKDRPHMVQNQEQYIFLYKAMVQWATLGQTIIPCYQFEDTYGSFKTSVNSQPSQIDLQFRCLKDIKVEYSTDEVELAHSESNKTKNRNLNILPKFTCRVLLTTLTLEMNGYINAIFLDGYQKLNSFIATQTPLPDTRVEFWGMILDYQCSAIVMLCPQSMLGKDEVYAPEARGQELAFDQTTVQNEECYQDGDIIINDLIACRKGKVFQVRQFSLSEKIDHCNAPSMFVQLHSLVEKWQQQKGQTKVVVHCMDGAQWTGVFCAATCLFNQINLDQEVDVFEMVQKLKTCRPNFFTGQKQYELLYDIVQHYLRQFQTYANFQ